MAVQPCNPPKQKKNIKEGEGALVVVLDRRVFEYSEEKGKSPLIEAGKTRIFFSTASLSPFCANDSSLPHFPHFFLFFLFLSPSPFSSEAHYNKKVEEEVCACSGKITTVKRKRFHHHVTISLNLFFHKNMWGAKLLNVVPSYVCEDPPESRHSSSSSSSSAAVVLSCHKQVKSRRRKQRRKS